MHRGAALCTWTNAHRPDASEPSIIVPCKKRRPGALTAVDHTSSNEWRHTLSSTKATSRLVASSKMHPRKYPPLPSLPSFFFSSHPPFPSPCVSNSKHDFSEEKRLEFVFNFSILAKVDPARKKRVAWRTYDRDNRRCSLVIIRFRARFNSTNLGMTYCDCAG